MKPKTPAIPVLFCAILGAATPLLAATVRTASETFVTNKIAAAVAAIPAPDFTTSNATLVATIEEVAPAPGNYANVSNAAMSAAEKVRQGPSDWQLRLGSPSYSYLLRMESPTNWIFRSSYPRLGGPSISLTRNDMENSWTLEYGAVTSVSYNPATINAPASARTLYFTITTTSPVAGEIHCTAVRTNETQSSSVAYLSDIAAAVTAAATASTNYTDAAIANAATASTNHTDAAIAAAATAATNYTDAAIASIDIPAPGNYAAVSNAAMSAAAATADAATAATNYTDEAVANIDLADYLTVAETQAAIQSATNDLVSDAELPGEVYRIVAGTNIVDVVTNYDSAVHAPARYLQQLTTNGVWKTIWAETNGLARTLAAANAATAAATNALAQVKADRAWSKYTSALGAPAPEGTTWLSTPTTVIAGGYEYSRNVTSSGQYWFLTSNGMTLDQGATNSFLNVAAPDGTPIFRIEKTDSQLVGVNASAISMVGSVAVVSVPVVGAHPLARVSTSLRNATWHKETEDGMPQGSPASVTWSGSSGAWVATIDFGSSPQGFCYFEQVLEGITKIVNDGVTELSGGILFNGVKYMPHVNGNKLEFVAQ